MSSPKRKRPRTSRFPASFAGDDASVIARPAVRYDFGALAAASPELKAFTRPKNPSSIDFSRPGATLALTRAILRQHFDLELNLPPKHLVPTIPSRHQYLAWATGLLGSTRADRCGRLALLDIGTGPSAIYALLAARVLEGEWHVVATDVDEEALELARENIKRNNLGAAIELLSRNDCDALVPEEPVFTRLKAQLALTVCNPPFYEEGRTPTARPRPGTEFQLETQGGELSFLRRLAKESRGYTNVWFTSLVGIKSDLSKIVKYLHSTEIGASQVVTTELAAGKRTVRWAVAWRTDRPPHSSVTLEQKSETASRWRSTLAVVLGANVPYNCDKSLLVEKLFREAVSQDERWSIEDEDAKAPMSASAFELTGKDGAKASCVVCTRNQCRGQFAVEIKVERGVGCLAGGAQELSVHLEERLERLLNVPQDLYGEGSAGEQVSDGPPSE